MAAAAAADRAGAILPPDGRIKGDGRLRLLERPLYDDRPAPARPAASDLVFLRFPALKYEARHEYTRLGLESGHARRHPLAFFCPPAGCPAGRAVDEHWPALSRPVAYRAESHQRQREAGIGGDDGMAYLHHRVAAKNRPLYGRRRNSAGVPNFATRAAGLCAVAGQSIYGSNAVGEL